MQYRNKGIIPRNEYGIPHGYCEVYSKTNNLWFKTFYVNEIEYGYRIIKWSSKRTEKIYYAK